MTARDIVNEYSESELYRVIRDYGEDKFEKNIAKHIVGGVGKSTIETTGQLNEIISRDTDEVFVRRQVIRRKNISGDSDRVESRTGMF